MEAHVMKYTITGGYHWKASDSLIANQNTVRCAAVVGATSPGLAALLPVTATSRMAS